MPEANDETIAKVGPLSFRIRPGTFDKGIIGEVIASDTYLVRLCRRKEIPVRTVLDVGAHIGVFTVFIKHMYPEARVIVFEPDPQNFALLQENTKNLTDVQLVNRALLDAEGELDFYATTLDDPKNTGGGSIWEQKEWSSRKIRVKTLDIRKALPDFLAPGEKLDFLKLDCEGSEYPLIRALVESGQIGRVARIAGEYHRSLADMEQLSAELQPTHTCSYSSGNDGTQGTFRALLK